jgi:transcriptional regulator with XRE-family HTH domain
MSDFKGLSLTMIAQNIRDLRRDRRLTQEALAEKAGLSVGAIKQIETGKRWPRPETIEAIARALGTGQSVLLTDYRAAKQVVQNERYPRLEITMKIIQMLPSASEGDLKDVMDLLQSRLSKLAAKSQRKA